MPLNTVALVLNAENLQGILVAGQLHSGPAGTGYDENIASAARQTIVWTTPSSDGSFGLDTPIVFDGDPNGDIYSLTVWSSATADTGTCYGEFLLTDSDTAFYSDGTYSVTKFDFTSPE